MKSFVRLFLAISLVGLILCGCSKDDDDITAVNIWDESNYDYIVNINDCDGTTWQVTVEASTGDSIATLALTIDDEPVSMTAVDGFWSGTCVGLTPGQSSLLEAVINGQNHSAAITIAYRPTLNECEEFTQNPLQAYELSWELAGDNMIQQVVGSAEWQDFDTGEYQQAKQTCRLSPDARSESFDANWLNVSETQTELETCTVQLQEVNWARNGRFIVFSNTGSSLDYYPHIIDIDDYDYTVNIVRMNEEYRDGVCQILVYHPDNVDPINTLTLTVNGTAVETTNHYNFWYGTCTGITEGQTCAVTAVINGTSYSATVAAAYIPSVNWPDEWDPTASHALTWTMGGNNMYQLFSGYSSWYDEEYDEYDDEAETQLAVSARSYTVPANWLDSGEINNTLEFTLLEVNWTTSGRFAVITSAGDETGYGNYVRCTTGKREIARDMLDKLLPVIK